MIEVRGIYFLVNDENVILYWGTLDEIHEYIDQSICDDDGWYIVSNLQGERL